MTTMDRARELVLVDGLRRGEAAAFEEVHAAFNTRLFSFLARLLNRRDAAEDLLEETWLRLVLHAPRLRPDTRLLPWLFTVARNLHTSYRRSRMIEDEHAAGMLGLWPSGRAEPSPLVAAAANEAERRLVGALAALPVSCREALLLVAVEGLTPAEAAEVCGISSAALRQRLSRGRALLARRLAADERIVVGRMEEVTA
jgi:RNA polymerase sigma-70 factor (ECF subfamily)